MSANMKEPIRAYGDRKDDGRVQLSFTLPVPAGGRAKEAAKRFAEAMGLTNVMVATVESAGDGFSMFVVYANAEITLDWAEIVVPEVTTPTYGFKELNHMIEDDIKRRVVVVGACTGSDAHTVGIDAILNMKGYAGDKGLEAYPWIDAYNMGAQVDNAALLTRAQEVGADAILVSQIMTQRDLHIENSNDLIQQAKKLGMRNTLFLLGGPRIDHKLARELGFDAGFGPGTKPSQVASFIVETMISKK